MEFSSTAYIKVIDKVQSFSQLFKNDKTTRIYFAVAGALSIFISMLFILMIKFNIPTVLAKLFYSLCFLVMGVYHIVSFPKYIKEAASLVKLNNGMYSLPLVLFIFICTWLAFSVSHYHSMVLALAATAGFLLPAAIMVSHDYYNNMLPVPAYRPWLPPAELPEQKVSIFLNSLQIRLQLRLHIFDEKESLFAITVPGRTNLGNMFHRFLINNETGPTPVQWLDSKQVPFAWNISVKRAMGVKILDPGLTLIENDVRDSDMLLFERILKGSFHEPVLLHEKLQV